MNQNVHYLIGALLSVVFTLCPDSTANGQGYLIKDTIIHLNFLDTDDLSKLSDFRVKNGTKIYLQIDNFNKELYTVTFNSTSVNFYITPPAIFNKLNELEIPMSVKGEPVPSKGLLNDFQTDLNKCKTSNNAINTYVSYYKFLTETLVKSCETFDQIKKSRDTIIGTPAGTEDANAHQLKESLDDKINTYKTSFDKFKELENKLNDSITYLENEIDRIIWIDNIQERKSPSSSLNALNKKLKEYKDFIKARESEISNINQSLEKVKTFEEENLPEKLKTAYLMINERNFTVISPAFIAKDVDEIKIDISFAVKEPVPCKSSIADRTGGESITGRVVGGLKIDFSTGFWFNFGKTIFDQSYRLDSIPGNSDQSKIVKNKNQNHIIPSLGALMHVYCRTGRYCAPSLSLGMGISDDNLIYHLGVSMLFGTNQRFVLSGGISLKQTQDLSSQYEAGQVIQNGVFTDVPTEEFWKKGYFISFTYNLSQNK